MCWRDRAAPAPQNTSPLPSVLGRQVWSPSCLVGEHTGAQRFRSWPSADTGSALCWRQFALPDSILSRPLRPWRFTRGLVTVLARPGGMWPRWQCSSNSRNGRDWQGGMSRRLGASIPCGCWFESQLLCLGVSSLLITWGKGQREWPQFWLLWPRGEWTQLVEEPLPTSPLSSLTFK